MLKRFLYYGNHWHEIHLVAGLMSFGNFWFFSCFFNPQTLFWGHKIPTTRFEKVSKEMSSSFRVPCRPTAWPLCWSNQRLEPRHPTCPFFTRQILPQKKEEGDPKGTSFLGPKNDCSGQYSLKKKTSQTWSKPPNRHGPAKRDFFQVNMFFLQPKFSIQKFHFWRSKNCGSHMAVLK